jgi:hypothetical protein
MRDESFAQNFHPSFFSIVKLRAKRFIIVVSEKALAIVTAKKSILFHSLSSELI